LASDVYYEYLDLWVSWNGGLYLVCCTGPWLCL